MFSLNSARGCTIIILLALMTLSGVASSSLRARESSPSWKGWMAIERAAAERSGSKKATLDEDYEGNHRVRSLVQMRNPQCTMPEEDPCVLNTTAIGMVEQGYATYYDENCELGVVDGCYTQNVKECRTCFLSEELYMTMNNVTEFQLPPWVLCPCCVPTALAEGHIDLEVQSFNYSIFDIAIDSCTDAPTQAPSATLGPTTVTSMMIQTPSPTPGIQTLTPETPAPTEAATPSPSEVDAPTFTPVPVSSRGTIDTTTSLSSAVISPTPQTSTSSPESDAVGVETAAEDDGGSDGMDTTTQVGIGVGVAVGVVVIGLAGFGILKASGRI